MSAAATPACPGRVSLRLPSARRAADRGKRAEALHLSAGHVWRLPLGQFPRRVVSTLANRCSLCKQQRTSCSRLRLGGPSDLLDVPLAEQSNWVALAAPAVLGTEDPKGVERHA